MQSVLSIRLINHLMIREAVLVMHKIDRQRILRKQLFLLY